MSLKKLTPIQFKVSSNERSLLETFCEQEERTMTDVLRELVRGLTTRIKKPLKK